jgi:ADP-ribose pyrophosphatase YjhB (NUDIX family)
MTAVAPVVGVGGVVVREGRVLLIRRGKPPLLGRWMIPGGTVELGETLVEALVREMEEETGLRVEPRQVLTVLDRIERDGGSVAYHFVIIDYLCEWLSGDARAGSDALEVAWVSPEELPAYDLTPKALEVVLDAFWLSSNEPRGSGGPSGLPPGGGLGAEPPE